MAQPFRIAVNGRFYQVRPTGVQRFAREVVSRVAEVEDVVVVLPRSVPPDGVRGARCVGQGARCAVRGRLDGRVWEQVELPWRARAMRCGVTLHPASSAPRWGGPHVVVVHDVTPLTHPEWYARGFAWWWRLGVAPAIRRAERVLAPSEWARAEIVRHLGVSPERIAVVSQGVAPFDRPAPPATVASTLERYGLLPGYVLAQGGASPRKNVRFLIDLFDRWRPAGGEPPQLVVVGEGYPWVHGVRGARYAGADHAGPGAPAPVPTSTAPEHRAPRTIWLGHVPDDDLHALYTAAGVFCFPSLAEGFGRPPLEAMACGTPAIVADYGPAREVLGDAALIVPLEIDVWRDAIKRLLTDPAQRAGWAGRGRRRAAAFTWEAAVATVAQACRAAVAEREAQRRVPERASSVSRE